MVERFADLMDKYEIGESMPMVEDLQKLSPDNLQHDNMDKDHHKDLSQSYEQKELKVSIFKRNFNLEAIYSSKSSA